jgi:hypothetical protein
MQELVYVQNGPEMCYPKEKYAKNSQLTEVLAALCITIPPHLSIHINSGLHFLFWRICLALLFQVAQRTKFLEQSPSVEDSSRSACQEIQHI